ncbi:hypothetical protein DAETH_35030 (plasmid) [Deinococcus aetherius]|uniref:NHL repeat containing protein n=1 Tax=Deinococcus aetherius TaxID=200252 RepID=A0ABN6RKX9_9DEIO|nr:ScyD/ScyE family protein [Deinococcus aetherius]BDP43534.1 hypothetical protein DAETH_35030 [Deinococcus aetherius]
MGLTATRRSAALLATAFLLAGCTREVVVAPAHGSVVASGLNGPQGVYVDGQDNVWVADSGTGGTQVIGSIPGESGPVSITLGDTARVVRVSAGGEQTVVTTLPSLGTPFGAVGASRLTTLGGEVYVTNGQWTAFPGGGTRPAKLAAVLKISGNAATEVADTYAWEAANNPDGVPAEQGGIDSHPYGLTALNGRLYITDAAANTLLRLDPATKTLATVTVFQALRVTPPGATEPIEAQAVPTGVAAGADGALYVALFPGGPELPGSARIIRVDPVTGAQTDYATGLSGLTDLRAGPDGNLYAVSFAPTGPGSGSVIRVKANNVKETVLGGLNFPTSIAFNARGDAFVAVNGVGEPGTGRVLRYDFLTRYGAQ